MNVWKKTICLLLTAVLLCSFAAAACADEAEDLKLAEVEALLESREESTLTKAAFQELLKEAGVETEETSPYYSGTFALTIDGEEIPTAKLSYCIANQFLDFINSYGQYAAYFGIDAAGGLNGLAEQSCPFIENGTWLDYFKQQGIEALQQSIALRRVAAEDGISISEEEAQSVKDSFTEFDTIVQSYGYADGNEFVAYNYGLGNTADTLYNYLEEFALAGKVYESYAKQFSDAVTAEEIQEQYPSIDIRHILVMAEQDENGEFTDEAKEAAKARAEEIFAEWQSGEATEESFASLAEQYSEDPGSSTNGGLYSYVQQGQMVEEFNDFCFDEDRQPGDTGIVYGSNGGYAGYHVMYFVGESDPETNESARSAISSLRLSEWLAGLTEDLEVSLLPFYKIAGHTM